MQLRLWTQPWACAPGTHYYWVVRDNVDSTLSKGLYTWPAVWESKVRSLVQISAYLHLTYNCTTEWIDWCFRPRSCIARLYWANGMHMVTNHAPCAGSINITIKHVPVLHCSLSNPLNCWHHRMARLHHVTIFAGRCSQFLLEWEQWQETPAVQSHENPYVVSRKAKTRDIKSSAGENILKCNENCKNVIYQIVGE